MFQRTPMLSFDDPVLSVTLPAPTSVTLLIVAPSKSLGRLPEIS
jgi:hypothetical protein